MSSGVLRGKESLNRIELSGLVQDLLYFFGVLGSLWLWGGGRWVGVSWGIWGNGRCPHMHAHVCTCTCTCTQKHVYMYRNCKWPLTWRHPCLACLTCMCICVCACVCIHVHVYMCVHGTPPHILIPTPTPIHPSATCQGTPRIS